MTMTVNLEEATDIMELAMRSNIVPFVQGSPGSGKSSVVRDLAIKFNLCLIDMRAADKDPTDFNGFPSPDLKRGKAHFLPMEDFPLEGDEIPKGYDGWLLFLDEFNAADRNVQKAMYKLILDRMIGSKNLHSRVIMICAGNLDTDGAITEDLSTAMQSRLMHITTRTDPDAWIRWAVKANVDWRIVAYIRSFKSQLNTFEKDRDSDELTFACERTWGDFANRLIQQLPNNDLNSPLALRALSGVVGEGNARQFIGYSAVFGEIPTIDEICKDPQGCSVPDKPSTIYALTGSIATSADEQNVSVLLEYLERIPDEFQAVCIRELAFRSPALKKTAAFAKWLMNNMDFIMDPE